MTAGFYLPTINEEGEPEVAHAPNFVYAPTYTLRAEQHANKTDLPGGWEWHDDVPAWAPVEGAHDHKWHLGAIVQTPDGKYWESLTDNNAWAPGETGWREVSPDNRPMPYQPAAGYLDAYKTGDLVTFEGRVYQSNIDGNVWSPAVAPNRWDDLGPIEEY